MFERILCLIICVFSILCMQAQSGDDKHQKANTEVEEVEVPIMTQLGSTQYKGHTIPHVILPALPK